MNDVITVGSPTSTGGKVITGSSGVKINGKSVVLVGDTATCKCGSKSCRGQGKIVKRAPRNANINGQDLARAGDPVDTGCGNCVLLPGQHQVALGTSMATPLNIGSGVNIGNGVNINMGAGAVTQSAASVMRQASHITAVNTSTGVASTSSTGTTANTNNQVVASVTSAAQPATTTHQAQTPQWQSLLSQPEVIYHTRNQMNDTTADDMQYGDLSLQSFLRQEHPKPYNSTVTPSTSYVVDPQGKRHKLDFDFKESHLQKDPAEHFAVMKEGMKFWTFWPFGEGHIEHILTELVDHFQANTGGVYSHPDLTQALKSHDTTIRFHQYVTQAIADYLTKNKGAVANDFRVEVTKVINREANLPAFNIPVIDSFGGGTLAVHGIYALQAQVNNLEVKQGQFRGTIEYQVQDHFGLDIGDVTENHIYTRQLELFRSWFYLRRYSGYGFKPFVTEMVFELSVEGNY